MRPVTRLQGMQDLSQESWRRKRELQDRLLDFIASYGYRCLETPILESTELFLRKSGGELASRMYSFTDSGSNPVSLRPEFTAQIMRHYLEHTSEIPLPARWQYSGPVFRYDPSGNGGTGQFTQLGAELLGSAAVLSDVELLGMAAGVPAVVGITGSRLELADLDVLHSLLDSVGLSERATSFIIRSVPLLRQGRQAVPEVMEQARRLNLTGLRDDEENHLGQAVEELGDEQARRVLQGLLQWSASDELGQRNPEEVVDRLLRKVRGADDESSLGRGLELASDLAALRGEPGPTMEKVLAVLSEAGADTAPWDRLRKVLDLLLTDPALAGTVGLDFGIVGGLAYYNGIIFEINHPQAPTGLGGGGRYDELARALGSTEPVPALGFAFNLDTILTLTGTAGSRYGAASDAPVALVLVQGSGSFREALRACRDLRREGIQAELDMGERNLTEALKYAAQNGIAQVVMVDQDGQRTSHQL